MRKSVANLIGLVGSLAVVAMWLVFWNIDPSNPWAIAIILTEGLAMAAAISVAIQGGRAARINWVPGHRHFTTAYIGVIWILGSWLPYHLLAAQDGLNIDAIAWIGQSYRVSVVIAALLIVPMALKWVRIQISNPNRP